MIKKILIIIQRSNGDVFLSYGLISYLYLNFNKPNIDLLVNDDTASVAKLAPNITNIITFSYSKKKHQRYQQETEIIGKIYKKYDLSICLTASDRSVIYASLASRKSISAIDLSISKSWWKKIILSNYYYFDHSLHIVLNNFKALDILDIKYQAKTLEAQISERVQFKVLSRLKKNKIDKFLIFHPSAQYQYKIYPKYLRDILLSMFSKSGIKVIITGGATKIDQEIDKEIPKLANVYNFIGKTSLEEYMALSKISQGYIGMDTLNMHIAASQNKRIFAIFGPTNLKMWSPWSNFSQRCAIRNTPLQTYDNTTIFQADLSCVACGKAGCDDNHGKSECLEHIDPKRIFSEIEKYLDTFQFPLL